MADGIFLDPSSFEDLGDKLFRLRGSNEIFCLYPLLSAERTETAASGSVTYDYGTFTVKITYEISGEMRQNPHWVRTYKEAAT